MQFTDFTYTPANGDSFAAYPQVASAVAGSNSGAQPSFSPTLEQPRVRSPRATQDTKTSPGNERESFALIYSTMEPLMKCIRQASQEQQQMHTDDMNRIVNANKAHFLDLDKLKSEYDALRAQLTTLERAMSVFYSSSRPLRGPAAEPRHRASLLPENHRSGAHSDEQSMPQLDFDELLRRYGH